MKLRLLFASILAFAVLSIPTFAQTMPKSVPQENQKKPTTRPVLFVDIHGNTKGPDAVSAAFLKPIMDGLLEAYELHGGEAGANESAFELRVFILVKGDQYYVSAILLAHLRGENIRFYAGSATLVTVKETAEADGQHTFAYLADTINEFLDQISASNKSEQ